MGTEGASVDGRVVDVALVHSDGSPVRVLHVDAATHPLLSRRLSKGVWRLRLRSGALNVEVLDERTKAIRDMAGAGAGPTGPSPVVAPMPGMVLSVEVEEGDVVSAGQGIAIVEAMKMENELRAAGEGVVSRVLAREGEAVEKGQVLVELAPLDEEG
jgi:pyruvate carboxylase subunit B